MRYARRTDTLQKTAAALTWRKKGHTPRIQLKKFDDSSVNFEVSMWIEDPWTMQQRRNDLLEAIWWALKDADVTIAFPQLDLHFDPPVVAALRGDSREETE